MESAATRTARQLNAGDTAPEVTFGPITRTDIVRYAGASGDFNPIHHDDEFAHASGMPGIFSMGMLHGGLLGNYVAGWLGLANVRSFGIRFTGQVWPGDVLCVAGHVDEVTEHGGERRAACSLTVTRGDGDVVMKGSATAAVA